MLKTDFLNQRQKLMTVTTFTDYLVAAVTRSPLF